MFLIKREKFENDLIKLNFLSSEDSLFLYELMNTKDWIEFIGERYISDENAALSYINKVSENQELNFWVITDKKKDQKVGVVTLIKKSYLDHPDIGFAMLPQYYRKGFAYKSSNIILDHYFSTTINKSILATSLKHNERSISLLKKLGFVYQEEIFQEDQPLNVYCLDKPDQRGSIFSLLS